MTGGRRETGSAAAEGAGDADRGARWDPGLVELVRLSGALAGGSEADVDDALRAAAAAARAVEVEEAILQSYLFLGFPVALNAFAAWRRVSGREAPAAREVVVDPEERGERTCRRVYGGAYEALRVNIARLKPELDRWMVVEGYGKVLSRPGLDLLRRECCICAILAVRGLPVQLRSHMRGALRCGGTPQGLDRILELVEPWMSASALREARAVRDTVVSVAEE